MKPEHAVQHSIFEILVNLPLCVNTSQSKFTLPATASWCFQRIWKLRGLFTGVWGTTDWLVTIFCWEVDMLLSNRKFKAKKKKKARGNILWVFFPSFCGGGCSRGWLAPYSPDLLEFISPMVIWVPKWVWQDFSYVWTLYLLYRLSSIFLWQSFFQHNGILKF